MPSAERRMRCCLSFGICVRRNFTRPLHRGDYGGLPSIYLSNLRRDDDLNFGQRPRSVATPAGYATANGDCAPNGSAAMMNIMHDPLFTGIAWD